MGRNIGSAKLAGKERERERRPIPKTDFGDLSQDVARKAHPSTSPGHAVSKQGLGWGANYEMLRILIYCPRIHLNFTLF